MTLTFRSDIVVQLRGQYGTDLDICEDAWVSSETDDTERDRSVKGQTRLIRSLLRHKHGTPFESGFWRWFVDAPRAVRDEAVRHRIASFSASSLRYAGARNHVYIPPPERPFRPVAGSRPMQPEYEPLTYDEWVEYTAYLRTGYLSADLYNTEARSIIDTTEATRWLTHDGSYASFIIRLNPRSVMHFLSLRTHHPEANHVSYPMWEIKRMADQMEEDFARLLPITYAAYCEFGREAP